MEKILCEASAENRECNILTNEDATEFTFEWVKREDTIETVTRIKVKKEGFICTVKAMLNAAAIMQIDID